MKKLILLSSICFISLYAEVEIIDNTEEEISIEKVESVKSVDEKIIKREKFIVDKEKALSDLETKIKNKKLRDSNKFEDGYFYGNLLKDNPDILDRLVNMFNKSNYIDTFIIIRKYAGIETKYFYKIGSYSIVDPLKYEKPSENIEGMLIGEYKYTRDQKYLNKLYRFSKYDKFTKYKLSKLRREIKEADKYIKSLEPKPIVKKKKEKEKSNKIPKDEFIEKKEAITKN